MPLFARRWRRTGVTLMRRNMRWVITYLSKDLQRVMFGACQYRNTYGTQEEAQRAIDSIAGTNLPDVLKDYPFMQPRAVECWQMRDGSIGDPKGVYFDV